MKTKSTIKILGIAQDGGVPQLNCKCINCEKSRKNNKPLFTVSLLLKSTKGNILFDASPDLKWQVKPQEFSKITNIVLTHVHMGHITGLLQFGFEIANKKNITVHCSKKTAFFLSNNLPYSELIENGNIIFDFFENKKAFNVLGSIITPLKVPHRDEHSDTFGFIIEQKKKVLFIPDIKNWDSWDEDIISIVRSVNLALIDGTFFDENELPHRDKTKIGHPLISDSIKLLKKLDNKDRGKVHFIHINHTNPILDNGDQLRKVKSSGFNIAKQFVQFEL